MVTKRNSHRRSALPAALPMTQPPEMRTKAYVYGVETLDGNDAWALFEACARGDVPTARSLVAKDRRLVNAQYWYRFPLHMAVFAGNAELIELLLENGADPGQSLYTYDSWDKLLRCARERGNRPIEALLTRAMRTRFRYDPEFEFLKEAIIARDSRKIGTVLRQRSKLARASDALGNNAIHWSVITRQLELIRRFVELGTPIDAKRADGHSPVLMAVNGATDYWYRATRGRSHPSLRNTSVIVGSLLALGANYSISVAAAVGDQERVEKLLSAEPELATRLDSAHISPLSYAAREGHLHIVRLLLEHGADPNQPEDAAPHGRALYEACLRNHLPVVELLLEHGANPNAGVDSSECCLTIGRVYNGDRAKPLEQLLRQQGAQMPPYRMSVPQLKQAIRDHHEVTQHGEFFGCVLAKRDSELLDLYLDLKGENPKRGGSKRGAAEQVHFGDGVAYPRAPSLLRKLLERGLKPNQQDWLGKTFLHACAEQGDRSGAAMLLEAGADINAREVEYRGTPLAAAVRSWCKEADAAQTPRRRRMVEFLLNRGAATNLPGDEPWATPLAWATRSDRGEIVELLKQHGAT
jgi:ankyrin repeat protein